MRLSPQQRRLLIAMDDGPEEDSVGIRADVLKGGEFRTADSLVSKGLAELHIGPLRFSTDYYRLTGKGRSWLQKVR